MDAGAVGVIFLAPAFALAKAADVLTKAHADIHAASQTRPSPINLQTISDIPFDCGSTQSMSVTHRMQEMIMAALTTKHMPGPSTPSVDAIIDRVSRAAFGSPLVTNVLRGQVVEAIVAHALEPEWTWCAADYASWDFERPDGLRLEVKQSAARQSWSTGEGAASSAQFDIAARKQRWEGGRWIMEPGRAAHLYVFAHHERTDERADHRDPTQWTFYVAATASLPATQKISLGALRRLTHRSCFPDLAAAVAAAATSVNALSAAS